jgi:hypothetical protein
LSPMVRRAAATDSQAKRAKDKGFMITRDCDFSNEFSEDSTTF